MHDLTLRRLNQLCQENEDMRKTGDLLNRHIYPALDRVEALRELKPSNKGNYYLLTCPDCGKRRAYIYKTGTRIGCNRRNKCAYSKSLWDYVQERDGLSPQETLRKLAEDYAGLSLSSFDSGFDLERAEVARRQEQLAEDAHTFFQSYLWSDGKSTLEYLQSRGYTKQDIEAMELGHWPGRDTTIDYLSGLKHPTSTIEGLFAWKRNDYHLVFPYRDRWGRIISYWGRLTRPLAEGESESDKYKPFSKTNKDVLFNLDRARHKKQLIVVEGYLDALLATARGVDGVVAVGGAHLTDRQLDDICDEGISTLILTFDGDKAGRKGLERSIARIHRREAPSVFVAPMPSELDPDKVIIQEGVQSFLALLDNAEDAATWLANSLATEVAKPMEKEALVLRALKYVERLPEARSRVAKVFLQETARVAKQDVSALLTEGEAIRRRHYERKARGDLADSLRTLSEECESRLSGGEDPVKVASSIADRLQDRQLAFQRGRCRDVLPFGEFLSEKFSEECTRDPNARLGHRLRRFPTIERHMDSLQAGFYLIAAHTNVGKTALLTNLFFDALQSNSKTRGLYFSLDDSRSVIVNRLLGVLTGYKINSILRQWDSDVARERLIKRITEAYELLQGYASAGRLDVKDLAELTTMDELERIVRKSAQEGNLVVAIDGLYNLEVPGHANLREENIARANRVKSLVDIYEIPVMVTGELRKKASGQSSDSKPSIHDLMESSKYAYNANLVWLLYPGVDDEEGKLVLEYEKNKLSSFKGKQLLNFYPAKGLVEEDGVQEEPQQGVFAGYGSVLRNRTDA